MSLTDEVHGYGRRMKATLERIKTSSIDESSKASLIEFYQHCVTGGYSQARTIKYLDTVERIARILGKSFESLTKADIVEYVRQVQISTLSDWTKRDYKIIFKLFFRWFKKSETYPEEVAWIKVPPPKNHTLPDQILSVDEVRKIAEAAIHPRDKALILVLYESGCRIGELLTLKIKNIQFDQYGTILHVDGKTGSRRIRIITSSPQLAIWLDCHPARDDPEAPVWVTVGTRRGHVLSYGGAKTIIQDIAEKAGLKKRVHAHLFRHSRATHLANHLTEAQMKEMFGWTRDSSMAATYVHLSGRDVDNALLSLNGIHIEKHDQGIEFKGIECPRCKVKNSPISKFCMSCGSSLCIDQPVGVEDARNKADTLLTELMKQPGVINVLMDAIRRMESRV